MQFDRRQVEFEQPHVLHDQGVGAGLVNLLYQLRSTVQLLVAQNGIECHQHSRVEAMCVTSQTRNIVDRVTGVGTGTEKWAADVDRVSAVIDRRNTEIGVSCGGEQFEFVSVVGHGKTVRAE